MSDDLDGPPAVRLNLLHAAHGTALTRVARRLCTSPEDADDLVQEAWLRASQALGRGPVGNPRGWLLAILRNLVIDRARRARTRSEEPLVDEVASPAPEPIAAWRTVSTEQHLAAVAELPPDLRRTYELFLGGARYRAIARQLGVSENTVASRLFRARGRLRDILTEDGGAA